MIRSEPGPGANEPEALWSQWHPSPVGFCTPRCRWHRAVLAHPGRGCALTLHSHLVPGQGFLGTEVILQ